MILALRAFLVLVAVAHAAALANFAFNTDALRLDYPILCNYLISFSVIGHVASLVATVLLWRDQVLGVAMITTAVAGLLVINVYIGAAWTYTGLGPISLAILLALIWPLRGRYRSASAEPADAPATA
ncbi:MAG: hypothetical protein AAGM22_06470 [Acidobacteriota bacterium]